MVRNQSLKNQNIAKALRIMIMDADSTAQKIRNWLALLAANRTYWQNGSIAEEAKKYLQQHFLPEISGYDIIIGYRADDSYFSFAQDFVANAISLKQLSEAMYLGKLGEQIVLKSPRAFLNLKFLGAEETLREEYFTKKSMRDQSARREYRKTKKDAANVNDLFMIDIMRKGIQNGDARLL